MLTLWFVLLLSVRACIVHPQWISDEDSNFKHSFCMSQTFCCHVRACSRTIKQKIKLICIIFGYLTKTKEAPNLYKQWQWIPLILCMDGNAIAKWKILPACGNCTECLCLCRYRNWNGWLRVVDMAQQNHFRSTVNGFQHANAIVIARPNGHKRERERKKKHFQNAYIEFGLQNGHTIVWYKRRAYALKWEK